MGYKQEAKNLTYYPVFIKPSLEVENKNILINIDNIEGSNFNDYSYIFYCSKDEDTLFTNPERYIVLTVKNRVLPFHTTTNLYEMDYSEDEIKGIIKSLDSGIYYCRLYVNYNIDQEEEEARPEYNTVGLNLTPVISQTITIP